MHGFPPPIWQIQAWSVGGILSIVVVGIIAPLIAARYSKPTLGYLAAWSGLTVAVSFLACGGVLPGSQQHDPYKHLLLIPAFLLLIAGCVSLRLWWRLESGKDVAKSAAVAVLVLFVIFLVILPSRGSRRPSVRTDCKNNLKQLSLAVFNYHDVHAVFPDASFGAVPVSWRISILPFVEQSALWQQYDLSQHWDSGGNRQLQKQQLRVLDCIARPTRLDDEGRFLTAYTVPTNSGSLFSDGKGSALETIADGTSNTVMILEACGARIIWSEPRDTTDATPSISINGPGSAIGRSDSILSSWHKDGAHLALADGSVRFVSESIEPDILRGLLTKNGGEPTGEF